MDLSGAAVIAGLYAAFLIVGWRASRKVQAASASEDLMVAGRSMPLWIAVVTMTATWVDGGYLLGTAENTYRYGLAHGVQGGIGFGISLVVGGLLFAERMRAARYRTMIDPFEERFGPTWAVVLLGPALLGELFWSGALLVALGSTVSVLLNIGLVPAILLSAAIVTAYTVIGGMWSVAYTDIVQLGLIPIGMIAAVAFAAARVGGVGAALDAFVDARPWAADLVPPLWPDVASQVYWTPSAIASWWDVSLMLVLGGIPWNCYFQRVLSCETPARARSHSIFAGICTVLLTVPPALVGVIAFAHFGAGALEPASSTLPRVLLDLTPYPVRLLGLAAIVGAVTSSYSASILSAGSMVAWNVADRLVLPGMSAPALQAWIRAGVFAFGLASTLLALNVRSVAALWIFTGDLVFVLLLPQLLLALYDRRANLRGSVAGFVVALAIRLSGGMSLTTDDGTLGFAALVPWHLLVGGEAAAWSDASGATLFPVRTVAALAGLVTMGLVSRLGAQPSAGPRAGSGRAP